MYTFTSLQITPDSLLLMKLMSTTTPLRDATHASPINIGFQTFFLNIA
ncbi:hypothetical protein RG47T_3245 [Mucilaginibacter polytrichastri]|uniref:Uncharacterized protein n=1 Tax=Mucilaginibacter polytrichastri TaxID=1302689 RepID=A0A1Q6A198_9SPHI|nr:hypothetical protein RG47T_3245 [Mucilaginibacter polytrichastri]